MEKQLEVMRRTIALAQSCLEGLEHAKSKMNEGDFENGVIMLHDVVNGYYQLEKSVQPLLDGLTPNDLERLGQALRKSFELVASAYEKRESAKAMELMQFSVVPNYLRWQTELNRCLLPNIVA